MNEESTVPIEVDDWWCPSKGEWSMCPGPCPDGTPHESHRRRIVMARVGEPSRQRAGDSRA